MVATDDAQNETKTYFLIRIIDLSALSMSPHCRRHRSRRHRLRHVILPRLSTEHRTRTGAPYFFIVSHLLRYISTKPANARCGPARHLTCFLPQTSAVGALEVGDDTERARCNGNG